MALGILATLEAKEGKGDAVESMLEGALAVAQEEEGTVRWHAFKIDETSFGILDVFEDEEGRQAHLGGAMAKQLMEVADELLASPPGIQPVDIIAQK